MATRTAGGNAAFHNFHNDYAHVSDPNERRRLALAEVDKAPFGKAVEDDSGGRGRRGGQ